MRSSSLVKVAVAAAVAAATFIVIAPLSANAAVISVGAGSYRNDRPAGTVGPLNSDGAPVTPKVTSAVAGRPVPTNEWWSSLVWQRYAGNPYSENMYAHPLTFHAYNNGLGVGYPTTPVITPDTRTYEFMHNNDLRVGVTGLNAPRTEVDGWGDWHVNPRWTDGTRTLRATIAHGSPYVYATVSGGTARVDFLAGATVFSNSGNTLGVTINGHHYGLFSSSPWTNGGSFATTAATSYSVAVLPGTGALAQYATYGLNVITNTTVSWAYNAANGDVTTTYNVATSGSGGTMIALYRHQWLTTTSPLTAHTYISPRGQMKVRQGSSFVTVSKFNGVLPALPIAADADRNRIRAEIDAVMAEGDKFKGATDTYWTGKALWRLAALIPVANQIGHTSARDTLISLIKTRLQEWLTSGGAGQFYYDETWDVLTGYPASFGSDAELNDHHFHYGYYILAAAMVAQHDSAWIAAGQWGGMVKLLVKEAANYDRSDTMFPMFRAFDPYAGHSWAAGHAGFAHGNNQESSSESMMFAHAMVLFGQASGDTALRNAGIYLYTTERDTIGQYWFDKDNAVFPAAYTHDTLGILWGAGGVYGTWWTANAEEIHGINMLPITGGSLYNGAWKPDIANNIAEMRASNGGVETEWRDVIWQFQAINDPGAAYTSWMAANPEPEWGDSRAHAYHWITALRNHGTPNHGITGNTPTSAVLGSGTYVAYNPSGSAITVTFSNGQTLAVPARAMAWRGPAGSGVENGGGTGPSPSPSPTASPTSSPSPSPSPSPEPPACSNPISGNRLSLGTAGSVSLPAANGNWDGVPTNARVFTACGLNGSGTSSTQFDLFLDSGNVVGNGIQVRVSYDLTGNGSWDRVETYFYFATDPVPGWEHYTQASGLKSVTGALGTFTNGKVQVEIWNAIGNGATTLGTANQSFVRMPY
jgi:endoglucanase Acf2